MLESQVMGKKQAVLKHIGELLGSVECREFLDFLKKDSASSSY
jgi:hypothetical protein